MVSTSPLILDILDQHALIQTVGWLKFTGMGTVLFRGQTQDHGNIEPSGLRGTGIHGYETLLRATRDLSDRLFGSSCDCGKGGTRVPVHRCRERLTRDRSKTAALLPGVWRASVEPLLQHYGYSTRWVDVVDNVWIALWFGCHNQITSGRHAYHTLRSVTDEGLDANCYVTVLNAGPLTPGAIPGHSTNGHYHVVDLRYAVPSAYLRPHAQHGLLIRSSASPSAPSYQRVSECTAATLRIRLVDAITWLGHGSLTTGHALFPPATRDDGYRRLLDAGLSRDPRVGEVLFYGPHA
ncbi:MAG: FRG domain-containing protein [Propionibacteriaceae bacterium]|nr:FRG domain-containing protein [Propionibacteriaceae bacterium]